MKTGILFIVCSVAFLSSCSLYMVATQPDKKDLQVLKEGTHREKVIKELGSPISISECCGKSVDIYEFVDGANYSDKTTRVIGYTLPHLIFPILPEFAAIYFEDRFQGEKYKLKIEFDERQKVSDVVHFTKHERGRYSNLSFGVGMQYSFVGVKYEVYRDQFNLYMMGGLGAGGGVEFPFTDTNKL